MPSWPFVGLSSLGPFNYASSGVVFRYFIILVTIFYIYNHTEPAQSTRICQRPTIKTEKVSNFTIFASKQVNLLQFHGCWQKTLDFWVRDKNRNSHGFRTNILCTSSPDLISSRDIWKGTDQIIPGFTMGCIVEEEPQMRKKMRFHLL